MKLNLIILLTFLSSSFVACSSFQKSTQEMERRSAYDTLSKEVNRSELPNRKKQRVEEVYMGGRMLSGGDWFVGGRLLLVVNEPDWIFDDPRLKKINER